MEGNIAKELYGESLQLSKPNTVSALTHHGVDEFGFENGDESIWDDSNEDSNSEYDLAREWQRRHDQFHAIGYREGIIAGKEAIAQEGFNTGYKQSVLAGQDLGLARGVCSALACLPGGLKEKLIEEEDTRNKFRKLHESLCSVSTQDALKLFYEAEMKKKKPDEKQSGEETEPATESCKNDLESYVSEVRDLLSESPSLQIHLSAE